MTPGEKLYNIEHPRCITVYRSRTPWASPMLIPNPEHVVDWKFITNECKALYEARAVGHNAIARE